MAFEKKAAKKETASKTKKVAEKKAAAPKEAEIRLKVQYLGKEVSQEDMVAAVKEQLGDISVKTMELYVKPEDQAVYYVVNGELTGRIAF